MKCDFCSDVDPQRQYPVQIGTPWAACRECSTLIDAGELLPLVRRILTRLVTPQLRRMDGALLAGMTDKLAEVIDQLFWAQRAGPSEPIYGDDRRGWDPRTRTFYPS